MKISKIISITIEFSYSLSHKQNVKIFFIPITKFKTSRNIINKEKSNKVNLLQINYDKTRKKFFTKLIYFLKQKQP